ncbi:MAG: hypothetical protein WA951_07225 [Leeuwenhoekiella sp.]
MPDKINEPKVKDEDTQLVKDKKDDTGNYIFQNTKITKTGLIIIVVFLVICVVAVLASGVLLGD